MPKNLASIKKYVSSRIIIVCLKSYLKLKIIFLFKIIIAYNKINIQTITANFLKYNFSYIKYKSFHNTTIY